MGDFSINTIFLLTLFFVPGFIYLKAYRLFIATRETDFSKDLYEAIGISLINAIIFSPLLYWIYLKEWIEHYPIVCYLILIIIIIAPLLFVWIFYKISKKDWYSKHLLNPNHGAWIIFFLNENLIG
jgi:hypothetical protein